MNLTILTQYYPPEIGAPQARLSYLARRFVENDHSVTVLTGMPNYPGGIIYPQYGGMFKAEEKSIVSYDQDKKDALIRSLEANLEQTIVLRAGGIGA